MAITLEQKEKNKNHLLNNIEDYMIDVSGNFADISEECKWFGTDLFYVYSNNLTPKGYEEVKEEIKKLRLTKAKDKGYPTESESLGESVLAKIEDWELDLWTSQNGKVVRLEGIKSKNGDGRKITLNYYEITHYVIIYELGYRGAAYNFIWTQEDYEKTINFESERLAKSKGRIEKLKKIYQSESTQGQNNSTTTNSPNINKYNVKLDDLDKNLWKDKNSWEEYLETLTSKQEIANFTESIRKKSEAKVTKSPSQSVSGGNKPLVFLLIGFFFLIGIVAILVMKKNIIRKK